MKIKELDETFHAKLIALSHKYPEMCEDYLKEMRIIIDWAEAKLKKIK